MTSRTEPLGEDRTLAILRHREKQENGVCPICLQFLDWGLDHAECKEALSPSKVERVKGGRFAPTFMEYEMMEPEK